MNDLNATKKPPLGIIPREKWLLLRFEDLQRAITEYTQAGLIVRIEWIDEYNKLAKEFAENDK